MGPSVDDERALRSSNTAAFFGFLEILCRRRVSDRSSKVSQEQEHQLTLFQDAKKNAAAAAAPLITEKRAAAEPVMWIFGDPTPAAWPETDTTTRVRLIRALQDTLDKVPMLLLMMSSIVCADECKQWAAGDESRSCAPSRRVSAGRARSQSPRSCALDSMAGSPARL